MQDRGLRSQEWPTTFLIVTIMMLASMALMFACASAEFTWDEADYMASTAKPWGHLWSSVNYNRHGHGPMMIYLAKLGQDLVPASVASLELRSRFGIALVGSLAIGFTYWALRYCFKTSRAAALVGSGLLLFCVARLQETSVISPHDLMVLCTLALVALGYHWRDKPTHPTAIVLGAVLAFGALSMTYVVPAAICWAVAVGLAGSGWFEWDRACLKISCFVAIMMGTAVILYVFFWPPGVLRHDFLTGFVFNLRIPAHHPTLVGEHLMEDAPRWAAAYWVARLDAPILLCCGTIIAIVLWKALRRRRYSAKHAYLLICLAFLLATALTAHLSGARSLLQFIAVACLATGALFDEALGHRPWLVRSSATAIVLVAALNLAWISKSSSTTPFISTDGYQAFVTQNGRRMAEPAKAMVFGRPILNLYAELYGTPVGWSVTELPWTTSANAPVPDEVKYVLIPALVFERMPAEQPMRLVVAEHWKRVWSHKGNHVWELRLYERPQTTSE